MDTLGELDSIARQFVETYEKMSLKDSTEDAIYRHRWWRLVASYDGIAKQLKEIIVDFDNSGGWK
ncbi:MAG: hypothetical protein M0R80_00670 [Proteobacteria bacterium]|jgi:hypothetical protein|nr:hypothetical protein [Pseudomonadota bacterium]